MPDIKVKKDSQEYYTIKAMYEAQISIDVILENIKKEYNIQLTRRTIERFAKNGKWERGKKEEIFKAKKLVAKEEVLIQFKNKQEQMQHKALSKQAEQQGEKLAINILQSENYKIEIANKLAEYGTKYMQKALDSLDNIKGGKVVDIEIEGIVMDENGKPANIIKKTTVLRPKEYEKMISMMQAFGILQTAPTVAIHNNNSAEASVDNSNYEKQLDKVKNRKSFQDYVRSELLVKDEDIIK